jgi:hypothetical protein
VGDEPQLGAGSVRVGLGEGGVDGGGDQLAFCLANASEDVGIGMHSAALSPARVSTGRTAGLEAFAGVGDNQLYSGKAAFSSAVVSSFRSPSLTVRLDVRSAS